MARGWRLPSAQIMEAVQCENTTGCCHRREMKTDGAVTPSHSTIGASRSSRAGAAEIYGPGLTSNVISAMGPKTSPRMRQVMASLIQHLHDFAREVELTVPEWEAAVEVVRASSLLRALLLTKTRSRSTSPAACPRPRAMRHS